MVFVSPGRLYERRPEGDQVQHKNEFELDQDNKEYVLIDGSCYWLSTM